MYSQAAYLDLDTDDCKTSKVLFLHDETWSWKLEAQQLQHNTNFI